MSGVKGLFKGQKFYTNPDREHVKEIRQRLKENGGYCPCRITKSEDTKCPCKEFREQENGYCHCELFYKEK